jgi:hypothetical protein
LFAGLFDVMLLGEVEIGLNRIVETQEDVVAGRCWRLDIVPTTSGVPLGYLLVILLQALSRAVKAQIDGLAVDRDRRQIFFRDLCADGTKELMLVSLALQTPCRKEIVPVHLFRA